MASEYGWALNDILEKVYFDELIKLIEQGNIRKIRDWRMQLAIVSNPHVKDPKALYGILDREEKARTGGSNAEFDTTGFENMKNKMSKSPRIIVK